MRALVLVVARARLGRSDSRTCDRVHSRELMSVGERSVSAAGEAELDGSATQALLKAGRFFTRWDESDDGRAVFREGGRAGDVFYRDRWSHDKVVRSTHGVNCTGSCSWKVYVKDGIITWESQETEIGRASCRERV